MAKRYRRFKRKKKKFFKDILQAYERFLYFKKRKYRKFKKWLRPHKQHAQWLFEKYKNKYIFYRFLFSKRLEAKALKKASKQYCYESYQRQSEIQVTSKQNVREEKKRIYAYFFDSKKLPPSKSESIKRWFAIRRYKIQSWMKKVSPDDLY